MKELRAIVKTRFDERRHLFDSGETRMIDSSSFVSAPVSMTGSIRANGRISLGFFSQSFRFRALHTSPFLNVFG